MSNTQSIVSRLRNSRLFVDSFWALLGSALGRGLSLLAGIAIARMLGSELYGEYGTIKNTLLLIANLSSMGLGFSATKFIAESIKSNDTKDVGRIHKIATYITIAVSGLIAVLIFIFAQDVAYWLEGPNLYSALRITSLAIIFNALNTTQVGELSGFGAYKQLAKNNAISGFVTCGLSIFLTYYYGFGGSIIALTFSLIFNCIINHISIRKCLKAHDSNNTDISIDYFLKIFKFSFPIALQEGLFAISGWATTIILIKFSGYTQFGISAAAAIWMNIMLFLPGALRNVSLSHLSTTNSDETQNRSVLRRLFLINLIATAVPCLIVIGFTKSITSFYGSSFDGLEVVLPISLLSAIVCSMANVLSQEYIAKGLNWRLFIFGAFRCISGLIALYFFTQIYTQGALISALVTLITHVIYLVLLRCYMYKS